jgi:hypothetical protein
MAVIYNRRETGLYNNGCAQNDTNAFFTTYTAYTGSSLSGQTSFGMLNTNPNQLGGSIFGNQYIPIDTSKTYQHAVSARTITNNYLGNPGSGHLGFACYDSSLRFIDLRNCGGIGDTTLSRDLNTGDTHIYLTNYAGISSSTTGWVTGASVTSTNISFRNVILFPSTHPEFNAPWRYTRIGFNEFPLYYSSMTLTTSSDWELKIVNSSDINASMPNIGYSTPAGTPVSRGVAGGTYNYAHGSPNYSTTSWITYVTSTFTGENRNSTVPFRYGTKYIRFLNLINQNFTSQNTGSSATYALDNIILVQCPNGTALPNSFFSRSDIL